MQKSSPFLITLILNISLYANDYGSLLFQGNCITCHNSNKTISAPAMKIVKENYLRAFPLKKDFVKYMSKWVVHPNPETSIMLDAIKKHHLMPELGYDIETIKQITSYIYETDF